MKNLKLVIVDALVVVLSIMMLSCGAGYFLEGFGSGVSGYDYLERLLDGLNCKSCEG